MTIRKFEQEDAATIANLLNNFLPFQEENESTVRNAEGIRFVFEQDGCIVGYIAGINLHNLRDEMPYFEDRLEKLHSLATTRKTIYTTHLVVHPEYRGAGIGRQLVEAYMKEVKKQAQLLIVVGWVQSDTRLWEAETLFVKAGLRPFAYIENYFAPYNVYCPNCDGICYCDAHIHLLEFP